MSNSDAQDALPFDESALTDTEQLLELLGWERYGSVEGNFAAWRREGVNVEALAPLNPDASDWHYMTVDVLELLRRVHSVDAVERAEAGVRLGRTDLEETRWHRESAESTAGIISWQEGEVFHAAIRNQLIAAAKAHRDPRPYFGHARAYLAQDFISKCFLGQSDVGSYVLTALTPRSRPVYASAPPEAGESVAKAPVAYSGAEIMRTFDRAISVVGQVLAQRSPTDQVQDLVRSVGEGISFELLNSLASFVGAEDAAIELRRQDPQTGRRTEREVTFPAGSAATLFKAAEGLAREPQPEATAVQGIVTLIEHDPQKERIIRVFDPKGPWHRVRVVLDAEQYAQALQAALAEDLVRVTGTVERTGRYNWIHKPESFEVVEIGTKSENPPVFEGDPEDVIVSESATTPA